MKTKYYIEYLILSAIFIFINSCKKEESPIDTPTVIKSNSYFSAKINGSTVRAEKLVPGVADSLINIFDNQQIHMHTFVNYPTSTNNQGWEIFIYLSLDNISLPKTIYAQNHQIGILYFPEGSPDIYVNRFETRTKLSLISKSDDILQGTFSGTLYKQGGNDSINVTEGEFKVKVYHGPDKGDNTPPVLTLKGNETIYHSLNSDFTDPGVTAIDNTDGDITNKIKITGSVNKDLTGTYNIDYSVKDVAGNVAGISRKVIVRNDAYNWEGNYSVVDSFNNVVDKYSQTILVSSVINNRIIFSMFANYRNNTEIFANLSGNIITLPSQFAASIGTLNEAHSFSGSGYSNLAGFKLTYTDFNITKGETILCKGTFVK